MLDLVERHTGFSDLQSFRKNSSRVAKLVREVVLSFGRQVE